VGLLAAVRGLVSEAEAVRLAVESFGPDAVAIAVGREDLAALLAYDGLDYAPENWEEELYVAGLSAWGEVRKPPPCFVEAVRLAQARGIPVRALDFNDEDYTEKYITLVTAWDLLGHSRTEKRARTHGFIASTPDEFVVEFDGLVNDPDGYVALERARERHIAARIGKLAKKHHALLAVIEYERMAGVRSVLDRGAPGGAQSTVPGR
jgi:hypothetical protein